METKVGNWLIELLVKCNCILQANPGSCGRMAIKQACVCQWGNWLILAILERLKKWLCLCVLQLIRYALMQEERKRQGKPYEKVPAGDSLRTWFKGI